MINVAVSGFAGRMGSAVVDAVTAADDMQVTCGIDPHGSSKVFAVYETVEQAVHAGGFDVLVDFTQPSVVEGNLRVALAAGIDCVVGTTGLATSSRSLPPSPLRERAFSTLRTSPPAPCS